MLIPAAGIIVYRRVEGEPLFLLLENASHRTWGFPKGHLEEGEDALACAMRECEEETGVEVTACDPGFRKATEHTCRNRKTGAMGTKRTLYHLACVDSDFVNLSDEHAQCVWEARLPARARLQFDNLREILDCAHAAVMRADEKEHPDEIAAYALLDELSNPDDLWRMHSLKVAELCGALAGHLLRARPELPIDCETMRALAVLHDIGRSRDHGVKHPAEGMRLLVDRGLEHLAKPCITHWLKGRSREELEKEPYFQPDRLDSLYGRFELDSFTLRDKIISIVDSVVHRDELVPLEVRYRKIRERYGDSEWMRENEKITKRHIEELEAVLKQPLYPLLEWEA